MNKEKQRIKIAEACGWTFPDKEHGIEMDLGQRGQHPDCKPMLTMWGKPPESWKYAAANFNVPDYLNDLNAMHEAEKSLTPEQQRIFLGNLTRLIGYDKDIAWTDEGDALMTQDMVDWLWALARATAAQRAEAFLRTLGLWEDGV